MFHVMIIALEVWLPRPSCRGCVASGPRSCSLRPQASASISERIDALNFEIAQAKELSELTSFFVKSFWLGSTTFGDSEVSWGEINQLERTVSGDLGSRYGLIEDKRPTTLSGNAPRPLFWKRMLVAREDDGSIVGCVGVEASLFDPLSGAVLRSAQADRVLNTELDAMDDEEVNELFSQSTGVASLANLVLRRDKELLVKQFLTSYVPCALLANLAVSPSFRRSGLGRELVELAETNCGTWGIDDMLLQVEEVNGAARRLYESLGYKPTFRKEDATALRLSPSKGGLSFLPIENKELLREEESPTVTMIKRVTDD